MPMDRSLYPSNWNEIAHCIKVRVGWTCEECGKPCRQPLETVSELIDRLKCLPSLRWLNELFDLPGEDWHLYSEYQDGTMKAQRFTLTVSHTNHDPWNPDAELRALCAPCHCRYDIQPVQMKRKAMAKLEFFGQINLIDYLDGLP